MVLQRRKAAAKPEDPPQPFSRCFIIENLKQSGQLVIDLCIVVISFNMSATFSLGKNRHRQTGMSVGGKVNAGFIVEQMSDGHRKGFIGAVEDIFFLCRLPYRWDSWFSGKLPPAGRIHNQSAPAWNPPSPPGHWEPSDQKAP